MTQAPRSKKPGTQVAAREERLKAALKANMARRKAQTRARADHEDKWHEEMAHENKKHPKGSKEESS